MSILLIGVIGFVGGVIVVNLVVKGLLVDICFVVCGDIFVEGLMWLCNNLWCFEFV